jgi:hypothetical protein
MTMLITVHGTNAGDPNDEGEHWWQKNSPFQKRLAEWLDLDGVEIEPFHWDEGPNSEVKRRKAGARLLNQLRALEKEDGSYYLIGHSHGGSVIHAALQRASIKHQTLPRLHSWLTIGTPFIRTRPRRFLFSRLSRIGKIFYLATLIALLLIFLVPLYFSLLMERLLLGFIWVEEFVASEFVVLPPCLIAITFLFVALQRSSLALFSRRTITFFNASFLPRVSVVLSPCFSAMP